MPSSRSCATEAGREAVINRERARAHPLPRLGLHAVLGVRERGGADAGEHKHAALLRDVEVFGRGHRRDVGEDVLQFNHCGQLRAKALVVALALRLREAFLGVGDHGLQHMSQGAEGFI